MQRASSMSLRASVKLGYLGEGVAKRSDSCDTHRD